MKTTRSSIGPGGQGGIVLDLTMQGDGLYHCVYTVQAFVGSTRTQFSMQVDTGSSDIWLASKSCVSDPSCSTFTGPKYDASTAQATGQDFNVTYHSGTVDGPIVIDTLEVGGYAAKGQALAAALDIQNEILSTGSGFTGLIGLAPQANSIIAQTLSKSDSIYSGSTFATHLFPNGTTANDNSGLTSAGPNSKFVSLLLERPYYPGVSSYLGLGAHPPLPNSLSSTSLVYSDIVTTNPGPLFWRVPLTRITIDLRGSPQYVPLSGTQATGVQSIYPVALIDSGGTQMISTRSLANAFYGTWGVGPGKDDGQYYVPCTLAMNVTLTLGSDVSLDVPLHPLDLSMAIPTEPSSATCLGALQASDSISQGDLILGASFMRNVYTVLSYDTNPPKLGLLPLVHAAGALSEFNTVRVLHQQLGDGVSTSRAANSTNGSDNDTNGSKGPGVVVMIVAGVGGFIVLAGLGLFLTSRYLRRRAMRKGPEPDESYAAVSRSRDLGISGKEKRNVLGRSIYGTEVDEAFTMFSASPAQQRTDKNSDIESVGSTSDPAERRRSGDGHLYAGDPMNDGIDRDFLAPGTRLHHRPRNAPYESVDSVWGSGSMAGLMQDPRFASVYSVNSTASSMKGLEVNMAGMAPTQPSDTCPGLTFPPAAAMATTSSRWSSVSMDHTPQGLPSHPTFTIDDVSSTKAI